MHSLIIFASGQGTNAAAIIAHFKDNPIARVSLIVCNKPGAGVLEIAKAENIPTLLVDKQSFSSSETLASLNKENPSLIILAGFLWKVPDTIIEAFRNRIVNIHPALLPDHGGKGMYGHHVHQAVLDAGKTESGITIHYVDEVYDSGDIIIQARCPVLKGDVPDTLAGRIHELEHFFFPRAIEFLLKKASVPSGEKQY
jgi:phosphoribosylglycinamide formyltransferase 1